MHVKTLDQIRALIIDMDGVLVRGATPLPGLSEFFSVLDTRQLDFVVATNNATTTPELLADRLGTAGVRIPPSHVITSAMAAADYLRHHGNLDGKVFMVGESPLRQALEAAGFEICTKSDGASAVVVGLDHEVSWRKLSEAAYAIGDGAMFIGTNPDPSIPTERGIAIGNGALLAALQVATGIKPLVIGKPETHLFELALHKLNTEPDETLVLGDRLDTDILGGKNAGLATALLLTGVTDRHDLENASIQPDWVFDDLKALSVELAAVTV
ncbi:MAG: HAD-IIA family hydrolase [Anaerolineales bacterium]|jgi:4-nitrophenyl phosphatase